MDSPRDVLVVFLTGAFSFAVGFAWNNTFQAIFREYVSRETTWIANLLYAVSITLLGILLIPYVLPILKKNQ